VCGVAAGAGPGPSARERDTMSDWIDRRFREQSAREQQEQTDEPLQLHRAKIVAAKGRDYMTRLLATAESQVTEFNDKFANSNRMEFGRLSHGVGFTVKNSSFPAVFLQCNLDLDAQVIKAIIGRTESPSHSGHRREPVFDLDADRDDNIVARCEGHTFVDPELFAAFLLESAIFGEARASALPIALNGLGVRRMRKA
jgi:hypothetical protein